MRTLALAALTTAVGVAIAAAVGDALTAAVGVTISAAVGVAIAAAVGGAIAAAVRVAIAASFLSPSPTHQPTSRIALPGMVRKQPLYLGEEVRFLLGLRRLPGVRYPTAKPECTAQHSTACRSWIGDTEPGDREADSSGDCVRLCRRVCSVKLHQGWSRQSCGRPSFGYHPQHHIGQRHHRSEHT